MKKIIMFLLSALGVLTSCNRGMAPPSRPPGGGENILMYGPVPVEFQNTPKVDDNQQQTPTPVMYGPAPVEFKNMPKADDSQQHPRNVQDQIENPKKDHNETDSEN